MIYEADEFPFTQMDESLGHVACHVNDCYFLVSRSECFVSQQRVVNDPRLRYWLLKVVKYPRLILFLFDDSAPHIHANLIITILLVEHRAKYSLLTVNTVDK